MPASGLLEQEGWNVWAKGHANFLVVNPFHLSLASTEYGSCDVAA